MDNISILRAKYGQDKKVFLKDPKFCKENQQLFKEFLELSEYKLTRTNGLSDLDKGTIVTLRGHFTELRNINRFFNNKPLKAITETDIKKVFDGLENGTIKNKYNRPFKDKKSFYDKYFKAKLFEIIGKADMARKVMEFANINKEKQVRFIEENDVMKLIDATIQPKQKALLWVCWDYGENINSILKTKRKDYYRELNPDTKEPEYRLNLRKDILKRSRTARSEVSNYSQTVEYLDLLLAGLKPEDDVFDFQYRMANKFFERAVRVTKVTVKPTEDKPTWKDLRSGMACHLLRKGWSIDEVNARLGHKPSSREIDCYVNFFALNRHTSKKKVSEFKLQEVMQELDESKSREKLMSHRIEALSDKLDKQHLMITRLIKKSVSEEMERLNQ